MRTEVKHKDVWVAVGRGEGGLEWCSVPFNFFISDLDSFSFYYLFLNGLEAGNGGEKPSNSYCLKDDDSEELSLGNFA